MRQNQQRSERGAHDSALDTACLHAHQERRGLRILARAFARLRAIARGSAHQALGAGPALSVSLAGQKLRAAIDLATERARIVTRIFGANARIARRLAPSARLTGAARTGLTAATRLAGATRLTPHSPATARLTAGPGTRRASGKDATLVVTAAPGERNDGGCKRREAPLHHDRFEPIPSCPIAPHSKDGSMPFAPGGYRSPEPTLNPRGCSRRPRSARSSMGR